MERKNQTSDLVAKPKLKLESQAQEPVSILAFRVVIATVDPRVEFLQALPPPKQALSDSSTTNEARPALLRISPRPFCPGLLTDFVKRNHLGHLKAGDASIAYRSHTDNGREVPHSAVKLGQETTGNR